MIKKLYAVFGVMAFLIVFELIALGFAMNTLSAVRAFVEGEALWSKAQKNAIHSLHQYALTLDRAHYREFEAHLAVPHGDHQARMELTRPDPRPEVVREGFLKGGIHPQDVDGVVRLLQRFRNISYLKRAIEVWSRGDDLVQELIRTAAELDEVIQAGSNPVELRMKLVRLGQINRDLTQLEIEFSGSLGAGSRWLEGLIFFTLLMAVLTVESTGLLVTYRFSRNLSRSLREIGMAADQVGRGNFDQYVPVHSRDELGQLAGALNKMIEDLRQSIGQRQQAESANQSKTMFLAHVSHELRTPLGVIMGYTELMKDPKLPEEKRSEYLQIIDHTSKNLNRIVNDILDISKVEVGHLDINLSDFRLADFIAEVEQMMVLRAQDRHTELRFAALGTVPKKIRGDRDRMRQILLNLVSNALKFTESGLVQVEYGLEGQQIVFRVTDTGVGIGHSDQERLFRQFSRVGPTTATEGAGLGLTLSRGLARMLGGDVRLVSSVPGRGSIFEARVKVEISSAGASVATTDLGEHSESPSEEETELLPALGTETELLARLTGKRILVVDDAPENQMLVRLFLTKEGVEVSTADDGQEGVTAALADVYDLVLMDMQMPVMNGFDATRELRRRGFEGPIVAFTANAMKGDERRCYDVGCNAFVTKPVEHRQLLRTLAEWV